MDVSQGSYEARGRSRSRSRGSRSRSRSASAVRARYEAVAYVPRQRPGGSLGSINSPNRVYSFKRTVLVPLTMNPSIGFTGPAPSSGTAPVGWGLGINFALSRISISGSTSGAGLYNVASSSEFTSLFDNFRIAKVMMKIVWNQNIATNTSSQTPLPIVQCLYDDDDSTPPVSATELLQRPDMKVHAWGAGNSALIHNIPVYPHAKMGGQSVSAQLNSIASRKQWIDIGYPDTEYYGYKFYWDTLSRYNANIGDLCIYFDIYYDFKGVR